jgi:hypothetical protein
MHIPVPTVCHNAHAQQVLPSPFSTQTDAFSIVASTNSLCMLTLMEKATSNNEYKHRMAQFHIESHQWLRSHPALVLCFYATT